MTEQRHILHVDMDAYYASVEMMDNPRLKGRPVIVGGSPNGRGVVAAASYEARKYGIHSAMSAYRASRLCPDAVFIKPRFDRYVELSRQIFRIFTRFTPLVEKLSIDEAFLDVTASLRLFGAAENIGRTIKKCILNETGLVASVGMAPNKFLAKLASDLEKPDGFTVITMENLRSILDPLPVSRIWGIGKKAAARLKMAGIYTIADMLGPGKKKFQRIIGSRAGTLLELAQGIDGRSVITTHGVKSIGHEITFEHDIADAARLIEYCNSLAGQVARRLRGHNMRAGTINIKARYPDFVTRTRSVSLDVPTASTVQIRKTARNLLAHRLGRGNRPLRLLGVSVSNLHEPVTQASLFSGHIEPNQEELVDHLVDRLQDAYGKNVIRRGTGCQTDLPD